ncbi:4559_t:CDS:2 [Cetraspora pellucida]|uniref:4559_t:CDS:1 n=1 Tax=Cetraspora pellucida TaxID=1433469 RepID=A0A9N8W8Y0_9GLOM|nr:4559_t:CDS:2 [Cetraspora pellucida]
MDQQNANKGGNKIAVCKSCIKTLGVSIALENKESIFSLEIAKDRKSTQQNVINESSTKTFLTLDNQSTSNLSNLSTKTTKQSSLIGFVQCPLSKNNIPTFENLMLRIVVSNNLPFSFVENPETQDVFNFLAPTVKLPGHRALSKCILTKASYELNHTILDKVQKDSVGVTAIFDGWINIRREHLFGIVLITSKGDTLIWKAFDISCEHLKTENVIAYIKEIMNDAKNNNIMINCFGSDSAGEYVAAREYINKIFLPCMALQMNLVVGNIFKESDTCLDISKKAIRIALAAKFAPSCLRENSQCSYEIALPNDILNIINNQTFWTKLYELQNLILPICGMLNKLQKDIARLHEAMWINYYYEAWFEIHSKSILPELMLYKKQKSLFDILFWQQFKGKITDFWDSVAALVMAQLHNDILRKRKIKQSEFHQNKAKRKHIAELINEESTSSNQDTDIDNAQITKEKDNFEQELDNSNNIIENKIQWEQLITNWIELAVQENKFDSNDDIYINDDHSNLNFSFGGRDIHPADDKDAK